MGMVVDILVSVLVFIGLAFILAVRRSHQPGKALRLVVGGLLGVNGLAVLLSLGLMLVAFNHPVLAQGTTATPTDVGAGGAALGAALATGLACVGAGIAVGTAGAAAIGSITEKPETLGRTLIFVGLAEGIAIYGLIISFIILGR